MRIKEYRRRPGKQDRTIHEIYYYTDAGREIAFYMDDGKGGPYSKVLYFSSALLAVPGYGPKSKDMTYAQRARPEYQADFREVESLHPGIPQSEYTDV